MFDNLATAKIFAQAKANHAGEPVYIVKGFGFRFYIVESEPNEGRYLTIEPS